jgi:hypothetical protein
MKCLTRSRLISSRLFTRKLVDVVNATGRSSGLFPVEKPSHPLNIGTVVWSINSRNGTYSYGDSTGFTPVSLLIQRLPCGTNYAAKIRAGVLLTRIIFIRPGERCGTAWITMLEWLNRHNSLYPRRHYNIFQQCY